MNAGARSGPGPAATAPHPAGFRAAFFQGSAAALGLLLLTDALVSTGAAQAQPASPPWPAGPALAELRIEIPASAEDSLRRNPRKYVQANLRANGQAFAHVGIHLKGATGSFRPYDDRPSLTLDLQRYGGKDTFDGVAKLHLNNAVEDPSLLHEWIGTELFREAGLPAARCSHARVSINGRHLGLYVLKEGFTAGTIARLFPGRAGTVFEPVPGSDLDGYFRPLGQANARAQRVEALEQLARAAALPDRPARFDAMDRSLVGSEFATFMAVEVLLAHRDGYTLARNNYRVFVDSETGRVRWIPHGMDQLFGQPDAPWQPHMAGLAARAWTDTPAGRTQYEEHVRALAATLLASTNVDPRIDRRVEELVAGLSSSEARRLKTGARDLKDRIALRRTRLANQLAAPPIPIARFRDGILELRNWTADSARAQTPTHPEANADRPALRLKADPQSATTWSTRVRLAPGRYRFEGRVRTAEVTPLKAGRNQGASLRVRGTAARSEGLRETQDWTPLRTEFEVPEGGDAGLVELICELRASHGEAWFETTSLRLVQIERRH